MVAKKSGERVLLLHIDLAATLMQRPLFSLAYNDLPFKASKLLCIAHNLAKVNVEHVSTAFQHNVVIVAVTDSQDERGHTPPCT